jgi:hypothetical protein
MKNYTQRELMNEGLWDKFMNSKVMGVAKQIGTAAKEITKTVAPEITDPISKMRDWSVNFGQKVKEAKIPFDQKLKNWISEQGKWALKEPKKTGTYAGGTIHYSVNIAEKGVDQKTGKETIGRVYRDPNAIIGFEPIKKEFRWIVKPRSDSYKTEPDPKDPSRKRYVYPVEASRPPEDEYIQYQQAPQGQTPPP